MHSPPLTPLRGVFAGMREVICLLTELTFQKGGMGGSGGATLEGRNGRREGKERNGTERKHLFRSEDHLRELAPARGGGKWYHEVPNKRRGDAGELSEWIFMHLVLQIRPHR